MRQALRPIAVQSRSAAAPATVTGEAPRCHWRSAGKAGGAAGADAPRHPQAGRPASAWICDGGRGVPRPARGIRCAASQALRHSPGEGRTRGVTVTLHVCTTCRMGQPAAEDGPSPRRAAAGSAHAAGAPAGVRIRPVECLSACDHGCNVALSAPGPLGLCLWPHGPRGACRRHPRRGGRLCRAARRARALARTPGDLSQAVACPHPADGEP